MRTRKRSEEPVRSTEKCTTIGKCGKQTRKLSVDNGNNFYCRFSFHVGFTIPIIPILISGWVLFRNA